MRKTTVKRKANTAMVFNPNRSLSIGGRSTVRKAAARKNPVRKAATVNPRRKRSTRRRSNPASMSGTLVASVMTALGIVGFDLIVQRIAPSNGGAALRIGIKAGGAYAFQKFGKAIPVIGKYNTEIAFVLGSLAAVDALRTYVLPWVSQTVSGLTGGNLVLINAPQAGATADQAALSNIYGTTPLAAATSMYQ